MSVLYMDNSAISQEISCSGWQVFLDEAKRRFADAKNNKERLEWRRTIRAFELLLLWRAPMPGLDLKNLTNVGL
jgi:hypothetical protein